MRCPHIRGAKPPNANIARAAPYGRGMPRPYAPAGRRTNSRPRTEQGGASSYTFDECLIVWTGCNRSVLE